LYNTAFEISFDIRTLKVDLRECFRIRINLGDTRNDKVIIFRIYQYSVAIILDLVYFLLNRLILLVIMIIYVRHI